MEQVLIDTSGFKALVDDKDQHYIEAKSIWNKLKLADNTSLVTSNFILDESFTLLRVRRGFHKAIRLRNLLTKSTAAIYVIRVTAADEQNAWKWFKRDWRDLSFTDCVTFALMERVGIQRVVAFDEHFSLAEFTLEK